MYGGDGRQGGYKRSFEDEEGGDGRYGGGYKRSRFEGGGSRREDRYGGGGGGSRRDSRYGGGGGAAAESERARAWRLAKKAVVELGESAPLSGWLQGQALREHASRAASRVLDEMDQDPERAKLGHLTAHVLRAATRLAHKTPLLAALAGAVNAKQPDFGRRLADDALAMLQTAVDAFDADKADKADKADTADGKVGADTDSEKDQQLRILLLVRFLALLVAARVVRADDVLGLLDAIQAVCTPDDFNSEADGEATSLRAREHAAAWKDFYAGVVLDALIHSGPALAVDSRDLYESLLSRCKEYISNREEESNPRNIESSHASNWLVRRLRLDLLWEPENEEELAPFCSTFDPLTQYWKALEQLRADEATTQGSGQDAMDDGEEPKIPITETPGVLSMNEIVSSSRWKHVEPHTLSTSLSINPSNFDSNSIPAYAPLFRVLTEESGAAGAAIAGLPLASYLMLRNDFALALETSYPKPAMAAKMLLSMCRNVNARFAAAANPANVRSEFLLVETLLVKALNETAPATLAYDCAVLTHLVKADARVISPALAIVVELLFRELPSMRAGARDAFVLLFSHFLSNFEFKWPWAHWTHVLEAEEDDAQRLFVSAVIERCVRLSYLQHMQSVLPTEFHMLLPPSPQPRIRFRTTKPADGESVINGDVTSDPSAPASVLCELYEAASEKLKVHPPATMLQAWLLEEIEKRQISRDDALEVVWTCILEAGAATYTHMRLLLEKYSQADHLRGGDSDELAIVRAVASVWLKSPQHIAITLNAMLRHGILRPTTIVQWVFTPDAVQQYSWPYVWGIVDDTLLFVQNEIIVAKAAKKAEISDGDKDMSGDDTSPAAQREQELRDMAKILFEGFNRVISAHKTQCDAEGVGYQDNWFASALARMKSVGRTFRAPLEDVAGALEAETFSSNAADHDARKVFQFVWDSYRSN